VTLLPGHGLASGAEEKVARVFEATKSFVSNLSTITGQGQDELKVTLNILNLDF